MIKWFFFDGILVVSRYFAVNQRIIDSLLVFPDFASPSPARFYNTLPGAKHALNPVSIQFFVVPGFLPRKTTARRGEDGKR
jgi:hypothetical protein